MRLFGRNARWMTALAVAGTLGMSAGPASASLDKCQKRIQGEGAKLQKFIYSAVTKCLDAIQKENVKGITTSLGTKCDAGAGCMPTAASFCEKQLSVVYDAANAKPGKSKVDAFRKAIEKSRSTGECADADLDIGTGLGHLLSGTASTHAAAPPASGAACDTDGDGVADPNCAGKFTVDYSLFALERATVNQILYQVPQALNLFQSAVTATATLPAGSKLNTSCTNLPASLDATTEAYRPNLCRFGVECREHACSLDPVLSAATIEAAPVNAGLGQGPVSIVINGSLATSLCRPGPASGVCKMGGGSCQTDEDCTGGSMPPCNLFPGMGEGAAFGTESNFLYIVGDAARTLRANEPPIATPPFNGLVAAACVSIARGEGWCSCNASAVKSNVTVCQDHITGDNVTTDDCGGAISEGSADTLYPGTVNGPLTVTTSGTTLAGGCVDLLTIQASLLINASDKGPDGVACTDDDFVAPIATLQVPGTTGTSTASIMKAVYSNGSCVGGVNLGQNCIEDVNCPGSTCDGAQVLHGGKRCAGGADDGLACDVAADCTLPGTCTLTVGRCVGGGDANKPCTGAPDCAVTGPPGACTFPPGFAQAILTGAGTNCANYLSSNLSGLTFVGGAPLLNGPAPLGDATLNVKLKCM